MREIVKLKQPDPAIGALQRVEALDGARDLTGRFG